MTEGIVDVPLYFIMAGEASGDLLGARLMRALKQKTKGQIRFAGIGGPRMQAEGMDLLFPQAELAHFGIFELLPHIPHILRRIRETIQAIKTQKPVVVISIDSPGFCFRVEKKLRGTGIPLIHYVAPTVWAWRPERAKKVAQFLDHLLVLLPFEPPYFTREGLGCTYVGHSIVESGADRGDAQRFRTRHNIADQQAVLTVLPGSRAGELKRLLPVFGETIQRLATRHADLVVTIAVAPGMRDRLEQATHNWPVRVILTDNDQDKYDGFAASKAALACSGTVALELALAGLPAVIAYRLNPVTVFFYRRLIKARFANLVNIMHDKMVVPEFLQENCTPEKLAAALDDLLTKPDICAAQQAGLHQVGAWLGQGQFVPSERAAETVLQLAADFQKRPKV